MKIKLRRDQKPQAVIDQESMLIDQYTRQKWASLFIDQLRGDDEHLKILDVGGYKGKTTEFQDKDNVTICDLFDVKEPNYVKGDGRSLPFDDKSFDFVVTFDTYEHVPREGRKRFIRELIRVSKKGVVLAAPFDDEDGSVFQAEVDLNDYHNKLYGKDHQWLKEHIDYRIPSKEEINKLLDDEELKRTNMGSNDLSLWIIMQMLYFSIGLDEDLRGRVDDINRYYNRDMQSLDTTSKQTYRQIYFISEDNTNVKNVNDYIQRQKNVIDETAKTHFIAFALTIWGQKYRDLELHKNYLEKEIRRLK